MVWEQCGCTDVAVNKISYKWKLKHFTQYKYDVGERLISPVFYSGNNNSECWELQLYPKGIKEGVKDHVSLFLDLKSFKGSYVSVVIEFSILHPKTNTKCEKFYFTRKYVKCTGYGKENFVSRATLLDESQGYLDNDVLTVCCDMEIQSNISHSETDFVINESMHSIVSKYQLAHDLRPFVAQRNHSDVTLSVDTEKIPAHKFILSVRSPVFSAMFLNEDATDKNNEVQIEGLAPDVVKEMLNYIYTDDVQNDALAAELLGAAEKYQLSRLKAKCELILLKQLDENNASKILLAAAMCSAPELKAHVIDFIMAHQWEVAQSEGYKNLVKTNLSLLGELFEAQVVAIKKQKTEIVGQ